MVGIPIYFYEVLSDGSEAGNRATFFVIGTFMAVWAILYDVVQAWATRIFGATRSKADLLIKASIRSPTWFLCQSC